jgi:hypothetical protein
MKTLFLIVVTAFLLFCTNACSQKTIPEFTQFGDCHDQRETVSVLKDCKGKVLKINEEMWALVPDDTPDTRYGVCEMPAELKVDQLKVVFSGQVKKIAPYERLFATPIVVTSLRVIK